jgi:sugar/nucleoside kinase (ribokinase family)
MDRPDVVVVGDLMVDVSVASGRLAKGGDVHGEVVVRPGGAAANAAVWAAWAGARVRLYGRVGKDLPGRLLREALAERGVEPDLAQDPEARTGAVLAVLEEGRRSMAADRGANARISPEDLPSRLEAGAVLLSGYLLFHPDSEPAARAALERGHAQHVAVDAASWPLVRDYGPDRFLAATDRASMLLANQDEARTLAPGEPEESARALSRSYRHAVVKRDGGGATLGTGGDVVSVPGRRAEPVDPTGAGDAFAGVLLARLVHGSGMKDALAEANEAAASVVESPSNWPEER